MTIRVFVADDHEIVRLGLERLLAEQPDMTVAGYAASARNLVELLRRLPCDVLVLDVNMPGSDGGRILPKVLALQPAPKVVIYTMYPEDVHAVRFLREGASAYLNKGRQGRELIDAIRKVHLGGRHITPELAECIFQHGIDLAQHPAETLSERELQVMRGLAAGLRSTEVAAAMGVSTSTVNTFVYRIKSKLGVRTTVEIVRFAEDNDLLG